MLYQTLHTFEIFLQCFQPKNKQKFLIINENLIMVNYLNTTIIIASLSLPKKKIIQWLKSRKCLVEMWNDLIDNHPIRFVETSKCCCHVTANRPIRLVMTSLWQENVVCVTDNQPIRFEVTSRWCCLCHLLSEAADALDNEIHHVSSEPK